MRKLKRIALAAVLTASFLDFAAPQSFAAPLYSFSNAGVSGNTGPTQAQVNSAYTGTSLAGLVTINTQGIQEWIVPTTGDYWIELAGASGGYTPSALGGKGRRIKIKVSLTAGNLIKILVGQEGGRIYFSTGYTGGGGGGTFIYNSTTSSYIAVAGGGGGAGQGNSSYNYTKVGVDAALYSSTAGTSGSTGEWGSPGAGGVNGAGGTAGSSGSSGAGINSNGARGGYGGNYGVTFLNGGTGGTNFASTSATTNIEGGFGGGSGGGINAGYEAVGGGGGGYSGGGGGAGRVSAGGGGGNYYTGTYSSSSTNTGHGFVTFQLAVPPTVSLAIAGSVTRVTKGQAISLTATVDDTVQITFYADGKRIPKCIGLSAVSGTVTCNWKPTQQKTVSVYSVISQGGVVVARTTPITVAASRRTGLRS